MLNKLKYKIFCLLSSGTFRSWCLFAAVLLLSACGDSGDKDATTKGAETNYNAQANCWQTKIAHAVTASADKLYVSSADSAIHGGANIVLVAFAVWMAFKLLKVLSSFKEENLGEVWTEIMQKAFICGICAYFLSTSTYRIDVALRYTLIPIYNALLELGVNALGADTGGSVSLKDYGTVTFSHASEACPLSSYETVRYISGKLNPFTDCMICRLNDRLNAGLKIGIILISTGKLGPIVVGIVILLLFLCAKFGFVLYLVDSLFRLNFALLLIPFLIAAVPFTFTRKWAKFGALMFLNSAGIMLFLGLLISVVVGAMEHILRDYVFSKETVEGLGTCMFSMFLIALLIVNVPGLAVTIADKFIGGGNGLEFQKAVSKFVVNSVKKAGAAFLGSMSFGSSVAASDAAEKYEKSRAAVDNIKHTSASVSRTLNSISGKDDD